MEGNAVDFYTMIGSLLGTPAAAALIYLYNKVKALEAEVKFLKTDNAELKKTTADIRSDVSFIRGKLEGSD